MQENTINAPTTCWNRRSSACWFNLTDAELPTWTRHIKSLYWNQTLSKKIKPFSLGLKRLTSKTNWYWDQFDSHESFEVNLISCLKYVWEWDLLVKSCDRLRFRQECLRYSRCFTKLTKIACIKRNSIAWRRTRQITRKHRINKIKLWQER